MTQLKRKEIEKTFPAVFTDFFHADRFFSPRWFEKQFEQHMPAVNIKENGKLFTIEMAAPGFTKDDFKIHVEENMLTISAEKTEEKQEEDERFARKEYAYNSFSRSFTLPENSNGDAVEAHYENGILKLALPKKDAAKMTFKKEIMVS
jgi:HSP20 family protein